MNTPINTPPSHAIYWAIAGSLISFGLMRHTSKSIFAIGGGALLLALKATELLPALKVKA